jgi:hypothetical protein
MTDTVTNKDQLRVIEVVLDNTVKRRIGVYAAASPGVGEQFGQHSLLCGARRAGQ